MLSVGDQIRPSVLTAFVNSNARVSIMWLIYSYGLDFSIMAVPVSILPYHDVWWIPSHKEECLEMFVGWIKYICICNGWNIALIGHCCHKHAAIENLEDLWSCYSIPVYILYWYLFWVQRNLLKLAKIVWLELYNSSDGCWPTFA